MYIYILCIHISLSLYIHLYSMYLFPKYAKHKGFSPSLPDVFEYISDLAVSASPAALRQLPAARPGPAGPPPPAEIKSSELPAPQGGACENKRPRAELSASRVRIKIRRPCRRHDGRRAHADRRASHSPVVETHLQNVAAPPAAGGRTGWKWKGVAASAGSTPPSMKREPSAPAPREK